MANSDFHYYIIDDSKLDCTIAQKIIKASGVPEDQIACSVDARESLKELTALSAERADTITIVFVDVRMPLMSGFEFIEAFEQFPESVRLPFRMYMLSSSINESDMNRAKSYKSVSEFLNKPLTIAGIGKVTASLSEKIGAGL
jgi:CheY-like chemotaxis protein